ncbi:hypothetical protein BP1258A_4921 [Burkholderia pseudomallei 1258a]|nr:hypothetical protein BP1258B_5597 [Burkholderia pseudomallei 1258b]EIF55015.1 hypothetical protein BP1258A_4921 [Burkholderia pseudomallei 1258a]
MTTRMANAPTAFSDDERIASSTVSARDDVAMWRCGGVAAWRRGGVAAWRRGDVAAWRRGDVAAWRRGGVATWRRGDVAAWRRGDVAAWRRGGVATWRRGDVAAWRRGGVATWRRGGVATWRRGDVAAWRRGGVATWRRGGTPPRRPSSLRRLEQALAGADLRIAHRQFPAHALELLDHRLRRRIVRAALPPVRELRDDARERPPVRAVERVARLARLRQHVVRDPADLRGIVRREIDRVREVRRAPAQPRRRAARRLIRLSVPVERRRAIAARLRVRGEPRHEVVRRRRTHELRLQQRVGRIELAGVGQRVGGLADDGLPPINVRRFSHRRCRLPPHRVGKRGRQRRARPRIEPRDAHAAMQRHRAIDRGQRGVGR